MLYPNGRKNARNTGHAHYVSGAPLRLGCQSWVPGPSHLSASLTPPPPGTLTQSIIPVSVLCHLFQGLQDPDPSNSTPTLTPKLHLVPTGPPPTVLILLSAGQDLGRRPSRAFLFRNYTRHCLTRPKPAGSP